METFGVVNYVYMQYMTDIHVHNIIVKLLCP